MERLKLNIQRFAEEPTYYTSGNLIDEEALYEYHDKMKTYVNGKIPTKTSDLTNDSNFIEKKTFAIEDIMAITSTSDATYTAIKNCINNQLPFRIYYAPSGIVSYQEYEVIEASYTGTDYYITYLANMNKETITLKKKTGSTIQVTTETTALQEEITNSNKLDYSLIDNTPTIPENTSDLTNDSGFITSSDLPTNHVTTDTTQDVTGEKTFKNIMKIQNGQGTGSMWIGGDVNANTLKNNTRHLARIVVPTYADVTKGATLLGFDSSGDSDMNVTNKGSDVVSFGGMKKITNATSPMAIGFCVATERNGTAANKKVYPLEMDSTQVRFNVQPNYNGTNLATTTQVNAKQDAITSTNKLNYDLLTNTPTIPSKTSDLTNDSNFITSSSLNGNVEVSGYSTRTIGSSTYDTADTLDRIGSSNELLIESPLVIHKDSNNNWNKLDTVLDGKQDTLVSGTNIKTINNQSLLGSGNINISSGGGTATDVQINGSSIVQNDVANLAVDGTYSSSNKIATMSSLPTVPTNVSAFTNDSGYITSSALPTKVSDLTNDAGYITGYTETDPVFSASASAGITSTDISNWNNKSDFSGDYDDLTNKPTIPSLSGLMYMEEVTLVSNATIAANSSYGSSTQTKTISPKSGYTPVLVVPSNTYDRRVSLWYARIDTDTTIRWRAANNGSTQLTGISVVVQVLYVKTSATLGRNPS